MAVDRHYRLKDRAATALEFLRRPDATRVHHLAVEDALSHLAHVDAKQVVLIRAPRVLPYALATMAAAALLFVFTSRPAQVSASPAQPLAVVIEQADRAAAELDELERFALEEKDPEVEQLVAQMKQALEEMKQPGVDLREALAKLSVMQSALEQQQAKQNVGQMDTQLQAVGAALALADPLAEASQALSAGQLEKAAEELEKVESPQLDRQTEKSEAAGAKARVASSGASAPPATSSASGRRRSADATRAS